MRFFNTLIQHPTSQLKHVIWFHQFAGLESNNLPIWNQN